MIPFFFFFLLSFSTLTHKRILCNQYHNPKETKHSHLASCPFPHFPILISTFFWNHHGLIVPVITTWTKINAISKKKEGKNAIQASNPTRPPKTNIFNYASSNIDTGTITIIGLNYNKKASKWTSYFQHIKDTMRKMLNIG